MDRLQYLFSRQRQDAFRLYRPRRVVVVTRSVANVDVEQTVVAATAATVVANIGREDRT